MRSRAQRKNDIASIGTDLIPADAIAEVEAELEEEVEPVVEAELVDVEAELEVVEAEERVVDEVVEEPDEGLVVLVLVVLEHSGPPVEPVEVVVKIFLTQSYVNGMGGPSSMTSKSVT